MSWRPGRSGSFRRSGIHLDGSSFRLSSRHSDDDSGSKTSSSGGSSSFLRMRPSSNSSNGSSSNQTSSNGSSGGLLQSRANSFRSRDQATPTSTGGSSERSLGWRRSRLTSPSPSPAQQKTTYPHPVVSEADKSSTLPWSYSSYNRPTTTNTSSQLLPEPPADMIRRSSSLQPSYGPTSPTGAGSPARPPSYVGSDIDDGAGRISRTGSNASSVSGWSLPSPRLGASSTLPGSTKRKLQKVELLHLTEPSREMVRPDEVVVSPGGSVFTATPIITPIERLRRKDREVARALEEKQKLIEEILHIPHTELESIAETPIVSGNGASGPRTAAEILLSTLSQAKTLTSLVNKSLKISEEEAVRVMASRRRQGTASRDEARGDMGKEEQQRMVAKGERLVEITVAINKQLTLLLSIVQDSEKEREHLRRELSRSQEQVKCLMQGGGSWSSPLSPATSMISSPLSPITPASISPMPSPLTSKSSSPPLSEGGERHSLLSSLSSLSGFNLHRQT